MSTPSDEPPSPPTSNTGWTTFRDGGQRFWVIPLVTFVVGIVLGGGVIALSGLASNDDTGAAETGTPGTTADATPTATSTGPGSVTIPGDCIQIATDAKGLVDLLDQAVAAARDLNADALSDIVSKLQDQQQTLSDQADVCRAAVPSENATASP